MAKINCRVCDICGEQLGSRDAQFWLKIPRRAKLYYGCPELGMKREDICDDCMAELMVEIQMRKKNRRENDGNKADTDVRGRD